MPSLADTLKSTRFPSASTTSAVVHTSWPAGVAAKVLYIYRSADGAFTCIQKRSYGIELSVFYHQNYRGHREHLRHYGVVASVGKVFGLHPHCRLPTDHKHQSNPSASTARRALTTPPAEPSRRHAAGRQQGC
jgi:hypothetical protein